MAKTVTNLTMSHLCYCCCDLRGVDSNETQARGRCSKVKRKRNYETGIIFTKLSFLYCQILSFIRRILMGSQLWDKRTNTEVLPWKLCGHKKTSSYFSSNPLQSGTSKCHKANLKETYKVRLQTSQQSPYEADTNDNASDSCKSQGVYGVLVLFATFVYVNGIFGDFVHDDVSALVENQDVLGTTPLWQIFRNDFWGKPICDPMSHKSYRPLTILTFRLERSFLGRTSAPCCHATNIFLHVLVTLLYVRVLRFHLRLSASHALVCGLIYSVHPIHTEAVTGIVGRADVLAALFFLMAFSFYSRIRDKATGNWTPIWAFCFVVSLSFGVLCKETAVTVVAVCTFWDALLIYREYKRNDNDSQRNILHFGRRIGQLTLLTSFLLLFRLLMMRSAPVFSRQDNPTSFSNSLQVRLLTFSYLPALNMWLLLNPYRLSHDWQLGTVQPVTEMSDSRNLAYVCLFGGFFVLIFKYLREKTVEGNAALWSIFVMIFSYLPASNLFFRVGFVIAERILYIPSLGYCTLLGISLLRLSQYVTARLEAYDYLKNLNRRIFRLVFFLFIALLCARTIRRNMDWSSRESLFRSGLKTMPHNAKMQYNFANLMRGENRLKEAIVYYQEAVRLWPDYPSAHNNLAAVLLQLGKNSMAEKHFRLALHHQPNHNHAIINLATLLRQEDRSAESILLLRNAFHSKLSYTSSISSALAVQLGLTLADLYADKGYVKLQEDIYFKLSAEFPMSADVYAAYGDFLVSHERNKEAARNFEAALGLDSTHKHALTSFASLMDNQEHHTHAQSLYIRALNLRWDADTATSLGRTHLQQGRLEEAAQVLTEVLIHNPHHLGANVHLAQVRLQQRHFPVSEALLRDVLRDSPNHRQALYHLSLLLISTNRSEESVATAQKAAKDCFEPRDFCATLHAHLADVLHNNAMLEGAVENYRKALNLVPSLVKVHLNLGAIYHIQGNYSYAWEHYSEALKLEPENSVILENIWKLQRIFKISPDLLLEGL